MRNVCREVLLASLVILDLGNVINYYYRKLLISEELRIGLRRPSYYLDLIYPAVVDVVDSYEVNSVFEAQDIIRFKLVAVIKRLKEIIQSLGKSALQEIRKPEDRLIAEQRALRIVNRNAQTNRIKYGFLYDLIALEIVHVSRYFGPECRITDEVA